MNSGPNVGLLVAGGALALIGTLGGYLAGTSQPGAVINVNEKPGLCQPKDSIPNQPVVIKVGAAGTQPDFKTDCEVPRGAVLAWVADTTVTKIQVRFVKADKQLKCENAPTAASPEKGGATTITQDLQPVPPLAITMTDKLGRLEFGYCLTVGDTLITPNPAIIIKPD